MSEIEINRVPREGDRSLPVFEEFDRMVDRIRLEAYNLFAHRGAGDGHALDDWLTAEREFCWPSAELAESEGEYTLKVAMAGFEPNEISVTATPGEIMIKAAHERRDSGSDEKERLRWSEFRSDDVMRRVELPTAVEIGKLSASLKNGMLEITAPKAKAGKRSARNVKVSARS